MHTYKISEVNNPTIYFIGIYIDNEFEVLGRTINLEECIVCINVLNGGEINDASIRTVAKVLK